MVLCWQANAVVAALVEALPDRRTLEANRLRQLLLEPGGKVVVWFELLKTRKPGGPQAGLTALCEMLNATFDKFQALGQEPASLVLAALCTSYQNVLVMSKQRKIVKGLVCIIGDVNCNEHTKKAASYVLRKLTEVSNKVRIELGSDRESLQLMGKVMKCEPLTDMNLKEFSETDMSDARSRAPSHGDASSAYASTHGHGSSASWNNIKRSESVVSNMGGGGGGGGAGDHAKVVQYLQEPLSMQHHNINRNQFSSTPPPGAQSFIARNPNGSGGVSHPNHASVTAGAGGGGGGGSILRPSTSEHNEMGMRPHSHSHEHDDLPPVLERKGLQTSFILPPMPAKEGMGGMGGMNKMSVASFKAMGSFKAAAAFAGSFKSAGVSDSFHGKFGGTFQQSSIARVASSFRGMRPRTASCTPDVVQELQYRDGSSRPATALGMLHTNTFVRETDIMCVQGNCCAAIGNACLSDEVIERIGKTNGIIQGVIYLLEHGTEWAAGHAARTLGNLTYCMENCKHLTHVDQTSVSLACIMDIILCVNSSMRTKAYAVHALGNMSRNTTICVRLSPYPDLLGELNKLVTVHEGISQQEVDRAITNISQARLGTKTWRQPKRI
jgi:hypothetical protein